MKDLTRPKAPSGFSVGRSGDGPQEDELGPATSTAEVEIEIEENRGQIEYM